MYPGECRRLGLIQGGRRGQKRADLSWAAGLPDRIAKARVAAGLTQKELSLRARSSVCYINILERGHIKSPSMEMMIRLSRALGVSIDTLIGLDTSVPDLHPEAMRIAAEIDALLRGKSA